MNVGMAGKAIATLQGIAARDAALATRYVSPHD